MSDGSQWDIPVSEIAANRARHYANEFGGDVHKSLDKDTLPLFESDPGAITDWAANNMNWDDVSHLAVLVIESVQRIDFQEGWVNGKKELL